MKQTNADITEEVLLDSDFFLGDYDESLTGTWTNGSSPPESCTAQTISEEELGETTFPPQPADSPSPHQFAKHNVPSPSVGCPYRDWVLPFHEVNDDRGTVTPTGSGSPSLLVVTPSPSPPGAGCTVSTFPRKELPHLLVPGLIPRPHIDPMDRPHSQAAPRGDRKIKQAEEDKIYVELRDEDVIGERGGKNLQHQGTVACRVYVQDLLLDRYFSRFVDYRTVPKSEKTALSHEIVEWVRERGGRFVKRDNKYAPWYLEVESNARQKVMQSLRDEYARILAA